MTTYPNYDPTSLFAGAGSYRSRPGLVAQASAVTKRGTLLGRVTATDKYIPCVKTASDGSQVPVAIAAYDIDSTAADATGPLYFEGDFVGEVMTIDASWTIATLQTSLRQAVSLIGVKSAGQLG